MDAKARNVRRRGIYCVVAVVLAAIGACNAPSCFPTIPSDDAGDLSWARQVVPILLGRKVKGHTEAKMLADMVAVTDRPTVLRALMQEPEFIEHWTESLVNTLEVDREGDQGLADCYGAPLRAAPDVTLAQHILANPPTAVAPGGAFNMSDVVRSAVMLDNLAPIYRAHLFAFQHRPQPFIDEQQARDEMGLRFEETYLNRQNTCLACHNSDISTTGPSSGWTRWFPIFGSFEKALYGANTGGDPVNIHEMFRTDQQFAAGSIAPWGISGCGQFKADMGAASGGNPYFTNALAPGATVTTLTALFKQGYDSLDAHNLRRTVDPAIQPACTACQTSCSGGTPLDPESVTNGTFVRDTLTAHMAGQCGSCHGATQGLWFYPAPAGQHWYSNLISVGANETSGLRVAPGDQLHSELIGKLTGAVPQQMPLGGTPLSGGDIQKVRDWITALPGASTCSVCPTLDCEPTHVDGADAFAYLAAARTVNVVWQEAMGYPLTIANYFPRNPEQRGALWSLTEYNLIPSHWSLRTLLVSILGETTFNRKPPDVETVDGGPYVEPRLYDPWVIPDPRVPPANDPSWDAGEHPDLYFNAMTDGIYRYSTWNLLRSTQKALDWPGPRRFPPDGGYPTEQLERSMGQYFSTTSPGFRSTNFAALLAWEKDNGPCANQNTDGGADWIERAATAAAAFDGGSPLTLGDLLVVERDWLLSEGTIATTPPPGLAQNESDALAGLVGPLTAQVSTLSAADLHTKLRGACGLLIETAQYFLAGIAPQGLGPDPRLRVCNGTPCSYQEMCNDLRTHITLPSTLLMTCGTDSISVVDISGLVAHLRDEFFIDFCPHCPIVAFQSQGCFKSPEAACGVRPPACDSRCSRIDCCGGPGAPVDRSGTVLLWADGAAVKEAEGVRIRRSGSRAIETLAVGTKLAQGDLLEVPAKSKLVVDDGGKTRKYEPSSKLPAEKLAPRYVLVTGPGALQQVDRKKSQPVLSPEQLTWLRTLGWRKQPDGATQRTIKPADRAPGRAEREWAERLKRFQQPKR